MDELELKMLEELAPKHPELQELWDKHNILKKQLDKLQEKPFFTPEEEVTIKDLKKEKLDAKTKMLDLLQNLK